MGPDSGADAIASGCVGKGASRDAAAEAPGRPSSAAVWFPAAGGVSNHGKAEGETVSPVCAPANADRNFGTGTPPGAAGSEPGVRESSAACAGAAGRSFPLRLWDAKRWRPALAAGAPEERPGPACQGRGTEGRPAAAGGREVELASEASTEGAAGVSESEADAPLPAASGAESGGSGGAAAPWRCPARARSAPNADPGSAALEAPAADGLPDRAVEPMAGGGQAAPDRDSGEAGAVIRSAMQIRVQKGEYCFQGVR